MRHTYSSGWFFRFATRVLKYFLLGLASFTVAYFLSIGLGFSALSSLLAALLERTFARLLVMVFSLMAIAIILESLRY